MLIGCGWRTPRNKHTSLLKLRDMYIYRSGAQGIVSQIHTITIAEPAIRYQWSDVAYLVPLKVEDGQAGEVGEWGDVAYLVAIEAEPGQAGEIGECRDIA